MTIKAIETEYAGCRFRSRLEARWAVFFDHMGINWEYEYEGYEVGYPTYGGKYYLPDFYLPETQTWVEVKGSAEAFDFQLLANAVDWGMGLPGTYESEDTQRGLLLLGPIPRMKPGKLPTHPILQHHKGGELNYALLFPESVLGIKGPNTYWTENVNRYSLYFDASWGEQEGQSGWVEEIKKLWNDLPTIDSNSGGIFKKIQDSYRAARSARFEHGECG